MVDCDKVPAKANVLRAQAAAALDCYGSNDDYKD